MTEIVSKEKSKKKRGNPAWIKGMKSPNPSGRGPADSSMRAAYEWALSLTPEVVSEILSINGNNDLSRQFKQMPRGVQLRLLVALRIVASVMFDPQPGLVNHVIDRIDGPIKNTTKLETWQDELIAALRRGAVTADEVIEELGSDGARTILLAAQQAIISSGETA